MSVIDLLFPRNCLACGKKESYLCQGCVAKVSFAATTCPVCSRFSFFGKTHDQCMTETSLSGLVPLWEHRGVIKKAISVIKYKFAYNVVGDVVDYAAIEVKKFKLSPDSVCIAVPLYRTRDNWRGFNQSEEFARKASEALSWKYVSDVLVRTESTLPQVQLQKLKRLRNIRGKIAVNTTILNKIDKKSPLIIVDDVWTTGATLKECARVLKQAGVKEVWGLTVAKA